MLKTWVEQIKKLPDHYGVEYWKYTHSNSMLELSVNKQFCENDNDYRLAIISIGKVLQALRQKFTEKGMQYHIQIFPNFDDSTLIAAIRTFSSPSGEPKKTSSEFTENTDTEIILEGLKNYANANQLSLTEVDLSDLKNIDIPETTESIVWFALCSDQENPFTWLRVGYWSEYLHNLKRRNENEILIVADSAIANNRLKLNGTVNNRYLQLVIGLPKS